MFKNQGADAQQTHPCIFLKKIFYDVRCRPSTYLRPTKPKHSPHKNAPCGVAHTPPRLFNVTTHCQREKKVIPHAHRKHARQRGAAWNESVAVADVSAQPG